MAAVPIHKGSERALQEIRSSHAFLQREGDSPSLCLTCLSLPLSLPLPLPQARPREIHSDDIRTAMSFPLCFIIHCVLSLMITEDSEESQSSFSFSLAPSPERQCCFMSCKSLYSFVVCVGCRTLMSTSARPRTKAMTPWCILGGKG